MDSVMAPLVIAVLALPAIGMAAWFARDPRPTSPTMAVHMALVGIVMLAAALALHFAAGNDNATRAVVIAMAVLVNALLASLFIAVRRIHRRHGQGPGAS